MLQILFSIYDSKAECYLPPFSYPAVGQGIRMFTDLAADREHPIGRHKSDYRLCRVGEFDDGSGEVFPSSAVVLCTGDEVTGSREVAKRA